MMKRTFAGLFLALLAVASNAAVIGETVKGTTDYSVELKIIDSTDGTPETGVVFNTAGIDIWYRREGAASVDITEATLAALTTAHTDGGFLHINDGIYRVDLPDAAVAAGADYVYVGGTVTGMIVIGGRIQLTGVDFNDSVRAGMTALPNAAADAAGGLPISDAGGLDLDDLPLNAELNARTLASASYFDPAADTVANVTTVATLSGHTAQTGDSFARLGAPAGASIAADLVVIDTNVDDIETDTADMQPKLGTYSDLGSGATLSGNLEDMRDDGTATFSRTTDSLQALRDRGDAAWTTGAGGTPPQLLQTTTIATLASQTSFTLTAGSADDDAYNGAIAIVTDQSTSTQKAVGTVSDYTGSTLTVTLSSDPAVFTMAVGDTIDIIASTSSLTTAQVNAEVDTALADIHLDHLLAADYDPASKPGVSTALLNELIESDGGVSRFTANALEQGPAGGSGLTAIATGTAQSATSTTLVMASAETFADDELIGSVVQITGGSTGVGQSRCITDNVGSTDTITVDAWTTTPTGTITYEIAPSLGGTCPLQASSGATSLNVTASGNIGIDWANVENATSTVNLSGTTVGTVTTNTDMRGTDNAATATALATAQTDLDTITGSDGVTLATAQANYAPATATALGTAQADLDTLTGTDGVTLATSQPNYAPATAASVAALNDLSQAQAQTAAAAALTAYDPPTDTEMDAGFAALNDPTAAAIAAAVLAGQIEDQGVGYNLQCTLATLLAYAAGDLSTTAGTSTFQDPSGTETRFVGTISGANRSSITITCP